MAGPSQRTSTLLVILAAAAGLIGALAVIAWLWADLGVTMTIHGWIAYGLGAVLSFALAGGLFWLLFHSARSGYDDIDRPEDQDGW